MKDQRIPIAPKLSLTVTHPLRLLLLRRLNQAFWLLLLMGLTAWGAWRFCQLDPPAASLPVETVPTELQQLQQQSLSTLDSSVTVLRMAVMTGQPETVLLDLTEQVRQQSHEVTLLSATDHQLLNQCLTFRQAVLWNVSPPVLSGHLASLQSQIRHLQHQASGVTAE